jgi:hypothetical protein
MRMHPSPTSHVPRTFTRLRPIQCGANVAVVVAPAVLIVKVVVVAIPIIFQHLLGISGCTSGVRGAVCIGSGRRVGGGDARRRPRTRRAFGR